MHCNGVKSHEEEPIRSLKMENRFVDIVQRDVSRERKKYTNMYMRVAKGGNLRRGQGYFYAGNKSDLDTRYTRQVNSIYGRQ